MGSEGIYHDAHLFAAGIRLQEHLNSMPPDLKELSDILRISEDELSLLSRRLEDEGIIGVVKAGGGERFFLKDHMRIEDLPRERESSRMEDELSSFKRRQDERLESIGKSLKAKEDRSKVFGELEKALKDPGSVKKKKNPLD